MKPSRPPTYPGVPNPYPPTGPRAPAPPQPLGFINQGNQAQGRQVTFITPPEILASSPLNQGNIQPASPVTGIATMNLKEEGKTLGAIQIIIGLAHIGFGAALGPMKIGSFTYWGFDSTAFVGGYPFWGGVCFIISGSLSIVTSKKLSSCLIKGSLVMNILSSIFALIGVILLLVDLSINGSNQHPWALHFGRGISGTLTIFSFLELGVSCTTAHFSCQTIMHTNRPALMVPTVYTNNAMTQQLHSAPAIYDNRPVYAPQ